MHINTYLSYNIINFYENGYYEENCPLSAANIRYTISRHLYNFISVKHTFIMATAEEIDQRLRDFQREYIDFLDDGDQQGIYSSLVR